MKVQKVYGSARLEVMKPKRVWWNNEVKAAVKRKEGAWKKVLTGGVVFF